MTSVPCLPRMSNSPEEQILQRCAFSTYGQHRELSLVRRGDSFSVFLDECFAAETSGAEYDNLDLHFSIQIPGKEPLEARFSHRNLTINNMPVEPWWTLEHGDNLDRPPPEVADFSQRHHEATPEDVQIPEFVHPRAYKAARSWWACCAPEPMEARPRSAATKTKAPHDPHEKDACACCSSDYRYAREDRPLERVCSAHCSYWGTELFGSPGVGS